MLIKKLNKEEYEIACERFSQYTELGIPLSCEFPLAPYEVDEDVKRCMDRYFMNLDPPSSFSFLYTEYGEPTIGHQKGMLFNYSFLVEEHFISITGSAQSVSFRMLIPPERMKSVWADEKSLNDSVARKLFEKGIPLMREYPFINIFRLLNEEERQINTENLIKFSEGILGYNNVFFSNVIKYNLRLEEDQFVWYQNLRSKVYHAVAEEFNKEYSAQMINYQAFEESPTYSEAKALFIEFCHSFGTKKIRFGSRVLTIRGFEAARRPAYLKPASPIITEDDSSE